MSGETPVRGAAAVPTGRAPALAWRPRRLTARMRLALSYALFLNVAGAATLAVVYLGMRYVPSYPLSTTDPSVSHVASRQEILGSLLKASGLALVALAVIGLWGGWVIAGRVLRPLQEITRAARRAADGSLDHRIGLRGRRDEFTDLSDTFDHMLDRLQRSFEVQQRFAANASHELRTPLAITRTMLDVARADPHGQDHPRLVARLYETNQRGIEVVDAMLQLSSLARTPPDMEPVDLSDTVREAVATTEREAADLGVTVSVRSTPSPVTGDGVLLRQLVVNLLQNALRHNLPADGGVVLTTMPDPLGRDLVLLTVSNTGPHLTAPVQNLVEPFLRGGGRVAGGGGSARAGHGLGLPIVARIAEAHGGGLRLAPNPDGGLTARVSLSVRG
ncbi:sensor histidine kinase [Nocardiopsis quinghaiensis]|uniref:sensor histidine kinase n=1 Tax=Nocardiopsis quinghaiensis TaxID=464995 RepID=UPI001CC23CBD|nr:HAMP domain-containing sensor histidine kinase [Nocardiopsis quinghaiensis]